MGACSFDLLFEVFNLSIFLFDCIAGIEQLPADILLDFLILK
jgi:hypothetical protein